MDLVDAGCSLDSDLRIDERDQMWDHCCTLVSVDKGTGELEGWELGIGSDIDYSAVGHTGTGRP